MWIRSALWCVDHFSYIRAVITEDARRDDDADADLRVRMEMTKRILTELECVRQSKAITTVPIQVLY